MRVRILNKFREIFLYKNLIMYIEQNEIIGYYFLL
jgi:hypothetical protein